MAIVVDVTVPSTEGHVVDALSSTIDRTLSSSCFVLALSLLTLPTESLGCADDEK
jgi:hypothetical protein